MPARIQDFIAEHHGTSLVRYFYVQAQQEAGPDEIVNEADFRYPGPSPRSKETAIVLLADTCEAAVRAIRPATREDLETLVNRLMDERVAAGELNSCNLTFSELQTIKEIFLHVLQGVHHPRIQYPEPPESAKSTTRTHPAGATEPDGIKPAQKTNGDSNGNNTEQRRTTSPENREQPANH